MYCVYWLANDRDFFLLYNILYFFVIKINLSNKKRWIKGKIKRVLLSILFLFLCNITVFLATDIYGRKYFCPDTFGHRYFCPGYPKGVSYFFEILYFSVKLFASCKFLTQFFPDSAYLAVTPYTTLNHISSQYLNIFTLNFIAYPR